MLARLGGANVHGNVDAGGDKIVENLRRFFVVRRLVTENIVRLLHVDALPTLRTDSGDVGDDGLDVVGVASVPVAENSDN